MTTPPPRTVTVTGSDPVTPDVKRFTLACASGGPLPAWSSGSHIAVMLTDGKRSWRNSYSLIGTPGATAFYEIAVRRAGEGASQGGSMFLHEQVQVGDRLEIGAPRNFFGLARHARKHLLIAGGIGITPFLSHLAQLKRTGAEFDLHYAFRERSAGAFWEPLCDELGPRAYAYVSSEGNRLSPPAILARQPLGTHVYVCGPHSLIDAVREAALTAGWPSSHVHFEEFAPPPVLEAMPFTVSLPELGRNICVGASETVLEALERAGLSLPSSCRVGQCGTCEMRAAAGSPEHRDRCLSESERTEGRFIPCVSRSQSETLTLTGSIG